MGKKVAPRSLALKNVRNNSHKRLILYIGSVSKSSHHILPAIRRDGELIMAVGC